jgi:hypothetical protein
VLLALGPSLLELQLRPSLPSETDLLSHLTATLPDMDLSGLTACPALVSSSLPDAVQLCVAAAFPLGGLTLLRSQSPSLQPLSTASLTRLNLLCPTPGLHHQPLLFQASFTTQLRELHLDFTHHTDAHVVPVAALPPLFCTHALLQLPTGPAEAQDAPRGDARTAARGAVQRTGDAAAPSAAAAGPSAGEGGVWQGLQQLRTLQVHAQATRSVFVGGGGLPDLLLRTPNLRQLVCPGDFRQGCAYDAARLRGCAQGLTQLHLYCGFHAAEDPGAEVEQVCEWVGSLRHLRQLCLLRDDIPGPLFAQVSHHWLFCSPNC